MQFYSISFFITRWLEVFFLEENIPEAVEDDFNVMNFVQKVGSTCCKVLQRHASLLDERFSSLGVRVSVREGNEVCFVLRGIV